MGWRGTEGQSCKLIQLLRALLKKICFKAWYFDVHDNLTLSNSPSKLVAEQIQTDQIYKASKYHSTKSIYFRRKTAQIKFYGQLALIFVVGSKY